MSPNTSYYITIGFLLLQVLTFVYSLSQTMTTPTRNLSTVSRAVNNDVYTSSRFRTTTAAVNDYFAGAAIIDEAGRLLLTTKERLIFHSKAVEGLEH
jgi:hypothetical protein